MRLLLSYTEKVFWWLSPRWTTQMIPLREPHPLTCRSWKSWQNSPTSCSSKTKRSFSTTWIDASDRECHQGTLIYLSQLKTNLFINTYLQFLIDFFCKRCPKTQFFHYTHVNFQKTQEILRQRVYRKTQCFTNSSCYYVVGGKRKSLFCCISNTVVFSILTKVLT